MSLTLAQFKDAIVDLRDTWAKESNKTNSQPSLFSIGEQAIKDLDDLITAVGGHPDPPPPRIRP